MLKQVNFSLKIFLYLMILSLPSSFGVAKEMVSLRCGADEISQSDLKKDIRSSTGEYAGLYHFGESECESDLHVIVSGEKIYIQQKYIQFSKDGSKQTWIFKNVAGEVTVKGNKLEGPGFKGEFMTYKDDEGVQKGLVVYKSPLRLGPEPEFGFYKGISNESYAGRYPEASLKFLHEADLANKTAQELRLMRNEIYARYGYIFQAGAEMDRYFRTQDWYEPSQKNVTHFLTELEKHNIGLILKITAQRFPSEDTK